MARYGGSRPLGRDPSFAGALIVLVFALAQGLFAAGIAATFAMAVGTALTTGAIAAIAVFAKNLALRLPVGAALSARFWSRGSNS